LTCGYQLAKKTRKAANPIEKVLLAVIVAKEMPNIQISNVALFNAATEKLIEWAIKFERRS